MPHPPISQYLISTCLLIVDGFNAEYESVSKLDLKSIADVDYNEMDLTARIARPFGNNARFSVSDPPNSHKQKCKSCHDIFVVKKDFKIEVKYLKNWNNAARSQRSNSMNWEPFENDFNWLMDEIDAGNKNKRAFVIGWFNCAEYFTSLIKLGEEPGYNPPLNQARASLFPFIVKKRYPTNIHDIEYKYIDAYKELTVTPIGNRKGSYSCIFVGQATDVFHFAIYC